MLDIHEAMIFYQTPIRGCFSLTGLNRGNGAPKQRRLEIATIKVTKWNRSYQSGKVFQSIVHMLYSGFNRPVDKRMDDHGKTPSTKATRDLAPIF